MIEKEKIEQIKSVANIVEVIGNFVQLKKKGSNYVGLSPFNNERTPSFVVNPSKNIFKDFSSGNGGDVIEFLMKYLSLKYFESILWIASFYKIDVKTNIDFRYEPYKLKQLPTSYIEASEIIPGNYYENPLFKYLSELLGDGIIEDAFLKYKVCAINDWCVFWQIDINGMIRSGKYIKYLSSGHRCKETSASWHHKKTKEYIPVYPDFNLVQCFFGEHLLSDNKPIAIVESEKTAVIASIFMDKYTWLACGSKYGLNDVKCACLFNKQVTLFPDLGAFNEWKDKARYYGFSISSHIEKIANEKDRLMGLDLADFLLR